MNKLFPDHETIAARRRAQMDVRRGDQFRTVSATHPEIPIMDLGFCDENGKPLITQYVDPQAVVQRARKK